MGKLTFVSGPEASFCELVGLPAFLGLERIRACMKQKKLSWAEALQAVWSTNVFTTHTPVPAGNERFSAALMVAAIGTIVGLIAGYFGGVAISALALSHDGRLLATGGHEDRPTVRVWDLRAGRLAHILRHPAGHYVYGLAFSPDGSQLVSGVNWDEDGEGAACVWELPIDHPARPDAFGGA